MLITKGITLLAQTVVFNKDLEEWTSSLILAKSRIAPLTGITPPRSEMNGFVTAIRLTTLAMRSLKEKPVRVRFILDSECTISALESEHGRLTAYLANRRGEALDTWQAWKDEFPQLKVEPLLHTPGPLNIGDLGTRDMVTAKMVNLGTEWQTGPRYLSGPFDTWPVSREFRRRVPEEERICAKSGRANCTRIITSQSSNLPNILTISWNVLLNILYYSDSIVKCKGVLARVLRLSKGAAMKEADWTTASLKSPLTKNDLDRAAKVMIMLMQPEVEVLLEGKTEGRRRKTKKTEVCGDRSYQSVFNMASLAPFKEKGIFWTQGRFGNELGKILGPEKLAILPPTCRLATLIMISSHNEAHRAGGDTCFRSRSQAWIVRGRPLADRIAADCLRCRRDAKKYQQQQMGMLPLERTKFPAKPWSSTAIDLLGPFKVKAMNNSRSKLKTWPIVFGCHLTGALHVELCWTYGTDAFLTAFDNFTAIRGKPSSVYTDRGSQLTKASTFIAEENPKNWDWDSIEEKGGGEGIEWKFCPASSQWRNGMAEQRVRALKDSLELLVPGGIENLNFAEFASLLYKCANVINDRPIGVRQHKSCTEGEILPLTPNLLLLGRASTTSSTAIGSDEEETSYNKRTTFIKELEQLWWGMWYRQVFDSLFPLPKWKERMTNLEPGDICLLGWEQKLGKGRYKLCQVMSTELDERNLVRSVEVAFRPTSTNEPGLPYRAKQLTRTRTAIQNLVLICPMADREDCD